ncbi:MAG: hypothetical protein ACXAEX_06755 [Promethearchaeota archaeon]|jgi:hypothetical protein
MKDLIINDDWVLSRVSSQSNSFSLWIKSIIKDIERSLEEMPSEVLDDLRKNKDFVSLNNLDKQILEAEKILIDSSGFGKKSFDFGMRMLNLLKKPIENEIKKSFEESDIDFELGFLTGKRKSLSTSLYDVSKERGIESEGLLYLIHALPDLEAFLYSTSVKKYYRDHTEHALRVAVLGDFLLEQDLGNGSIAGIISELTQMDKKLLKEKIWWITGLLHDIGYPLGKMTTAVNYSLVNQLLKCYPTLDLEFTPLEINLNWKGSQEDYLDIIEKDLTNEARSLIRIGAGFSNQDSKKKISEIFLKKPEGHPEYNFKSSVNLDHGVIAALSLLRSLGDPGEIQANDEFHDYIKVAQAIALHNFKPKLEDHNFSKQPLAFLLMLIDELQEWGRPIPIQVRDTYFTTELKKVNLLDELYLKLDEFSWLLQFKNQQAKELMNFNFQFYSSEKKNTFGRLSSDEPFPKTTISLQDIEISTQRHKRKEKILSQDVIVI